MAENKPTRAEETRRERRFKPGSVMSQGTRLSVDMSKLNTAEYEYRWGNDDAYRVQYLHDRDWDPAPEQAVESGNGMGTVNTHLAGTDKTGKPFNAVLLRKPKDWFAEDQKRKLAPLAEMDRQLRAGRGASASSDGKAVEHQDGFYTPGTGTNKL